MATETEMTAAREPGPSSPVVARYRARTVAVDGYLDLAVVQIYATADGKPVSPGSLHLPYLTLGNVAAVGPAASVQITAPATTPAGGGSSSGPAVSTSQTREESHMSQLDAQGEAHEALGAAAASYGQRVLSDPHALGNLVPDLPRERSLLVTGAEADIAAEMREHVERHHIDPDTAVHSGTARTRA